MTRLTDQQIEMYIRLKMLRTYAECADNRCTDMRLSKLFGWFDERIPAILEFACIDHDHDHWLGDWSGKTRLQSNTEFREAIAKTHPKIAELYFHGVQIGSVAWSPFPWRWGFGWRIKPSP